MNANQTKQIISRLGGVSATARLCKVTRSAVCQWKDDGIPEARLMFLKLARPEAFDDEEDTDHTRRVGDKEPT